MYSRVGSTYVSDWEIVVSGVATYPNLEFDGSRLALGVSGADHDSFTDAGEVQVYLQSGASWALERSERAGDAVDSLGVGTRVAFDGGRILTGTSTFAAGYLYAF